MRDNLSISQKGLLLLAIPLVFQTVFLTFLVRLRSEQEELQVTRARARDALIGTENLFRDLMEAQSDVRGYVITEDEGFLNHKNQVQIQYEKELQRLRQLVADDVDQTERLAKVAERSADLMRYLNDIESQVTAGDDQQAIRLITAGEGELLRGRLRESVDEFLSV
jgi:CHASE3 domain sensor protein